MLYSGCGAVDAQAQLVKLTVQFVCFGLSCETMLHSAPTRAQKLVELIAGELQRRF